MVKCRYPRCLVTLVAALALCSPAGLSAEQVNVRYAEGLAHGFLVLRALDGTILASGDLYQISRGDRVTTRTAFHFKDGSIHDETAVFSQRHSFQLISDHLIQKEPSFPHPLEMQLDALTGRTTVNYTDDDGKAKSVSEQLKLAPDLANGLIPVLLKNVRPETSQTTLSMVAATPRPRLVKLVVAASGGESFFIAGSKKDAIHYVVKIEIGGVAGLAAQIIGKQPPDTHVWILGGEAPAFVRMEAPPYSGGPVWRVDLAGPSWPPPSTDSEDNHK